MKYAILALVLIAACSVQGPATTDDLILNEQDVSALGLSVDHCLTEPFQTGDNVPVTETSFCNYTKEDSAITIILTRYSNTEDLNGAYQYDSSHYYSADGLISEDTYGDQSRFRVNSENDYGGELNDPNVHYYHLWITKDLYLIHITSKGVESDKVVVADIGERILSKFG